MSGPGAPSRPVVAFFDYADAFEDFYPHYGVSQAEFACRWHGTGNHLFVRLLQQAVGEVVWYQFAVRPELDEARHEWCGCRVRFLATSALHRWLWRTFYLSRAAWRLRPLYRSYALLASYSASLTAAFLRRLRAERPSVLFCQDYANGRFDLLILLGRLLGLRVVAYHAGSSPARYLGRALKRWTIPRADFLLVSSRREAELLADVYRVPRERLAVLLTPVDTAAFRPLPRAAACAQAGLDPQRRYLLYVGRLDDRVKRVGLLIDCVRRLAGRFPELTLLIAGAGGDRAALAARAGDCGQIHFLGWRQGAAELAPLYAAAEALLLVSRSEGFPTVVGEGLACGTPVIACDVGGVSELVTTGETGWLLPAAPDEAVTAALEQALGELLSAGEALAPLRRRAREMALARLDPLVVAAALRACCGVADG